LEEPIGYEIFKEGIKEGGTVVWAVQCKEYQKAKDRVLFKGFTLEYTGIEIYSIENKDKEISLSFNKITLKSGMNKTIQDLVHLDLELTENVKVLLNIKP